MPVATTSSSAVPAEPIPAMPPSLVCPICNREMQLDNLGFNQHVDECLNKAEVKAILQSETSNEVEPETEAIVQTTKAR